MKRAFFLLCLTSTLFGCATENSVLFVTKTSVGVDFDAKPEVLSVAYDRKEGYLGPRYDNGAVPPVTASIKSDGGIFTGKVKQIYATGNAALTLASGEKSLTPQKLVGNKKVMFFGTDTTTGLKVGFTGLYPDSFAFGFKRKEYSYIPVGKDKEEDTYPSVIAAIDTTGSAIDDKSSGLTGSQFFATGLAADHLANDPVIRAIFNENVTNAIKDYRDHSEKQRAEINIILKCYAGLKEESIEPTWKNADSLKLYFDKTSIAALQSKLEQIKSNPELKASLLREAHIRYASEVSNVDGKDNERQYRLRVHSDFVCSLAREK